MAKTKLDFNYFKCKTTDYITFEKDQIYHKDEIGHYLQEYPKDWVSMPDYPTNQELIAALEDPVRCHNQKVINILKKWCDQKR